jgi:hypothetical protein
MGTGCFLIPDDIPVGHYIGQWYWNTTFVRPTYVQDSAYKSCFDFEVVSAGTSHQSGFPPGTKEHRLAPFHVSTMLKLSRQSYTKIFYQRAQLHKRTTAPIVLRCTSVTEERDGTGRFAAWTGRNASKSMRNGHSTYLPTNMNS